MCKYTTRHYPNCTSTLFRNVENVETHLHRWWIIYQQGQRKRRENFKKVTTMAEIFLVRLRGKVMLNIYVGKYWAMSLLISKKRL